MASALSEPGTLGSFKGSDSAALGFLLLIVPFPLGTVGARQRGLLHGGSRRCSGRQNRPWCIEFADAKRRVDLCALLQVEEGGGGGAFLLG